jgi:hypothetical protein
MTSIRFRLLPWLLFPWFGLSGHAEPALALRMLVAPAGSDSGESNLYRGPDGTVYLTWSGPGDRDGERALRFAMLAPGSTGWSRPRTIVSTPLLMENWADFASLVVATDGALWAQWFQSREADGHGYDGWIARSADGGVTWTAPAPLGHEFVSLAPLSEGRILAVWLSSTRVRDPNAPRIKRDSRTPRPPPDPNAPYAPSMRLESVVLGPDGRPSLVTVVDPDVCTCCQTTLTVLGGDQILVAYRGHTRDEIRDNLVARFDGTKWDLPRLLHADGWKIPACPVNGPAADTRGPCTAIAWFTAANGVARVQAKLSTDRGRNFGPALAIDIGRPIGRLDLVSLPDGSAVVSWLESATTENAAGLYVRRVFPDGTLSAPRLLAATSAARSSGFPRLALRGGGTGHPVIVSWTEAGPGRTQVQTAEFYAAELTRTRRAPLALASIPRIAVIRAERIEFLELCSPGQDTTAHP